LFIICSIIKKKLLFEVLHNAVREKPAQLEELTLLKVCFCLILEYFRKFWYRAGKFSSFWTGNPGGPAWTLLHFRPKTPWHGPFYTSK